jgi:hypothetical protein
MPVTPRERLARVLDGSQAPGAFSAQLSVPRETSGSRWRARGRSVDLTYIITSELTLSWWTGVSGGEPISLYVPYEQVCASTVGSATAGPVREYRWSALSEVTHSSRTGASGVERFVERHGG